MNTGGGGIQDVGTIGTWTPARLTRYIQNEMNLRQRDAKTSLSADSLFAHNHLTFSSGDFQTADTVVQRPSTGILTVNGLPLLTGSTGLRLAPYAALQTVNSDISFGGANASRTNASGWYMSVPTASPGGGNHTWLLGTAPLATERVFTLGVINDATDWRFIAFADGQLQWGPGNAALDTTLLRSTTNPPSGNTVGLQANNPITVNDPNGFKVIQATNNAAFTSYFLNTDANPAFKIFAQGAMLWGAGGAAAGDLEIARIVNSTGGTGTFLELVKGDGFGYGTATGGAVTQLTSRTTGVTLNKPTGVITCSTTPTTIQNYAFTVTNSIVGINDTVIVNWRNPGTNVGAIWVSNVAAGSFKINFALNVADATAFTINYSVIKGSAA